LPKQRHVLTGNHWLKTYATVRPSNTNFKINNIVGKSAKIPIKWHKYHVNMLSIKEVVAFSMSLNDNGFGSITVGPGH